MREKRGTESERSDGTESNSIVQKRRQIAMYLYAYICGTEGDRWIGSERRFLEGTRETVDE